MPPSNPEDGFPEELDPHDDVDFYPWLAEETRPRDGNAEDWMPDAAMTGAAVGVDGLEPGRRDYQVNVRLSRERYAALRRAAEVYGTTPTALARMLLNRGSTAILNAYRAEMAAFEWADPKG